LVLGCQRGSSDEKVSSVLTLEDLFKVSINRIQFCRRADMQTLVKLVLLYTANGAGMGKLSGRILINNFGNTVSVYNSIGLHARQLSKVLFVVNFLLTTAGIQEEGE
jgi:hypothetical protein